MTFEFLKFISYTALWAWVLSDIVSRYAVPYIERFFDALDEMANVNTDNGKGQYYFRKTITVLIQIIFAICLTYVMTSWSVWCILRCVLYTQTPDVSRPLFFITGGICCVLSLGSAARATTHKNFLSVVPYVVAMGAFVVFSLNYEPIRKSFPWLIKFVGLYPLFFPE